MIRGGLIWRISDILTGTPQKYGLAHTNYDDNFVFDEKIFDPL